MPSDLVAEGPNLLFARYNRMELASRKSYRYYSIIVYFGLEIATRTTLQSKDNGPAV
jgi:hypothetical protein